MNEEIIEYDLLASSTCVTQVGATNCTYFYIKQTSTTTNQGVVTLASGTNPIQITEIPPILMYLSGIIIFVLVFLITTWSVIKMVK